MSKITTLPRLHLAWVHGELLWVAHTGNESLYVDHSVYARCRREHFISLGLTWQTWTQYIQPAEDAWRCQCEAEDALQACLDFWREVPGVRIVRKGERSYAFL